MSATLRFLPGLALLGCALLSPGLASAIDYRSSCDALTDDERQLIEDAYEFLRDHQDDVRTEVLRDRAGNDDHSYSWIGTSYEADWKVEVEDVADGTVDIACRFAGDGSRCDDAAGTLAYTSTVDINWFDKVYLCVDNLTTWAVDHNLSPVGLMSGVIGHELAHHVDGFESHGPGGQTDPTNPDTLAETIGVAVENLYLTPDLVASIGPISSQTLSTGHTWLRFTGTVTNANPGSDTSLIASSGFDRNSETELCLYVDGSLTQTRTVSELDGDADEVFDFSVLFDSYTAGQPTHEVQLVADCDEDLLEWDESNTSTRTYSTVTDLVVEAELSAAPTLHTGFRPGGGPAIARWYAMSYDVTVTNADSTTPAPPVDLAMRFDDYWDGGAWVWETVDVSELQPGSAETFTFTFDVPAALAGGPSGSTQVWWWADPDMDDMFDASWHDNAFTLDIDADYWQPDYRISGAEIVGSGTSPDLEFSVVNMGPAAATSPSFARLVDDAGATVSLHLVTSLASMAAGGPYTTTVDRPLGDQASYTLSVDAFDVVSESDETNNSLSFSLGYPLASGLVSEARAELFGSIDPGAGLRFDELLGFIETMGPSALHELMDWALQTGSPGPIDPEGPLGQAWTHTVSLDDGWLMMSVPTTARVHHAVAQQAWAAGIY